jgi:hypothetical protein
MTPRQGDALANLRDIHLPEAVAFWPPAPGWWLAGALLIATGWFVHRWLRARRRSLRRAALRELAAIEAGYAVEPDVELLATGLSTLLRRVAVARFPRRDVAALHGNAWIRFLLAHDHGTGLTRELARDLAAAVYAGPRGAPPSQRDWAHAVGGWIRGNT